VTTPGTRTLARALLPPEAGGPDPAQVARAVDELLALMPRAARAAPPAAALALQAAALARHGRLVGGLRAARRSALLDDLAASGPYGGMAVDGLKALMLLAWGGRSHAGEIAAVANAAPPVRPDAELDLVDGSAWPDDAAADVVVVGSGAGGAFAARELARAGRRVVVVEEGRRWTVADARGRSPLERFGGAYRDGGSTVALGVPPVALPIGRAVGGTTVVNSGTCFRPPPPVAAGWHRRHGLALAAPDRLAARLDDVEATLGVAPGPLEVLGRNGALALEGAAALGWSAAPLRRNAPGCRGSCQCALVCPQNAKAGVHLNALPQACAAGATIVARLRVRRLLHDRGAVTGVEALRRDGSVVRLRAPVVVVAAGATETPPLLRRSGLGGHPRLGRGLSVHPALGAAGRFAEPVVPWRGILQSVGVEELHDRHGILIEATATPPGMGSMVLPGHGRALLDRLADAGHVATLGAMIADAPAGRVLGARRAVVAYRLTREDGARLVRALGAMAELLLAAGAEEVELGGGAPVVRSRAGLPAALEQVRVRGLHLAAFHPTGTAAAGADPAHHPVDDRGRLRGVRGAVVADASILPSCPGVNPQVSVMALAAEAAAEVA
jgi:choline dehydrogenase-like flavoprotein